jgi:predicted ester cyclase
VTESNSAIVRRFVEDAIARGLLDHLSELVAEDYVGHLPFGDHYGLEGIQIDVAAWRVAFPDLAATIELLLVDGDVVVRRFTLRGTHEGPFLGLEATRKRMKVTGIAVDRLVAGRMVESWVAIDLYGLVRQLGGTVVPTSSDAERGKTIDGSP